MRAPSHDRTMPPRQAPPYRVVEPPKPRTAHGVPIGHGAPYTPAHTRLNALLDAMPRHDGEGVPVFNLLLALCGHELDADEREEALVWLADAIGG